MKTHMLRAVTTVLGLGLALAAHAQRTQLPGGYPTKPVRILVGSSPGGGVDAITRAVAQRLTEQWGHSVIVDNRTGAGGALAVTLLTQAAPDGYTLYGGGSQVVTLTPLKKVSFDTRVVLSPVAQFTSSYYFLLVHPSLPVRNVNDLIALAKRRPSALNYGSAGTGSASHLGTELFKARAGIDILHIPYKGNGQALIDLVGGQTQMLFTSTISGLPHVQAGRVRGIAVSSPKRLPAFPDVPTIAESGVAGFELDNMYGLYAPAGISVPILNAINAEVGRIMHSPDVMKRVAADGAEVAPANSPSQFRDRFVQEMEMWEKFIRTSGIKVER